MSYVQPKTIHKQFTVSCLYLENNPIEYGRHHSEGTKSDFVVYWCNGVWELRRHPATPAAADRGEEAGTESVVCEATFSGECAREAGASAAGELMKTRNDNGFVGHDEAAGGEGCKVPSG